MTNAVVLGAGMAGLLAAAVLADHGHAVTVIESDRLPDGPEPRPGVPQAHHSHLLLGGGADALDSLLPGTIDELLARGANRRGMPSGLLAYTPVGWMGRNPTSTYMIAGSRHLIDDVVRRRVLANPAIEVRESTTATGLVGDADRVRGVRLGDETITAELVVDATGRRSPAARWLVDLGLPEVEEETVDAGLAYATLLLAAPPGVEDMPVISFPPHPGTGQPGRAATLIPVEGNRWIVTLVGTRGGEPAVRDLDGFIDFARRQLPHPIIADLLTVAEPLGPIRPYRATLNRRRLYENLPVPDGFVVLGDAATALDPVYGHGLSLAAFGAQLLAAELDRGVEPGFTHRVQSAVALAMTDAWAMASGQDRGFPDVIVNRELTTKPVDPDHMGRVHRLSTTNPDMAEFYFSVVILKAPLASLFGDPVRQAAAHPALRAPLSAYEAIDQFPALTALLRGRCLQ